MTITLIILFIIIGLFLIWLEFFIVPGISVAGIGGTIMLLGGIYFAYANVGNMAGHIVLSSSVLITLLVLILSFRGKTWDKTSLKTNIEGTVEGVDKEKIAVGDHGVCISRLAPMGKIMVNGIVLEAKSRYGYIDEKENIKIVEIYNTNVLVEKNTVS